MTDEEILIKTTFEQYADAFQALEPAKVIPFIHFPAIFISPEKIAVMGNQIVGHLGFRKVMKDLKKRCFSRSIARSIEVQQLSDNLALVTGIVIRYKRCTTTEPETLLECFNLNYTMRKVKGTWKIVVGVLTETAHPAEDSKPLPSNLFP
jgi:ketosteroid isomerase-like protein